MVILGLDPGIAIVGFAFIKKNGQKLVPLEYGSITTSPEAAEPTRIKIIYDSLKQLMERYQPEVMAVEKLFFNRNVTTAFTVGQARGVMLLAAEEASIPVVDYTPLQVKQAVVGYGQAEKRQVQEMVRLLLGLKERPKPDDVADALAVAICHAHTAQVYQRIRGGRLR